MKRRDLLQLAGTTCAALGLGAAFDRYGSVLAQSTPRKIALLVGINAYPENGKFSPLNGCVTDTLLQQELLVNRFGFNPKDILIVTDAQATRQGILTAFDEHLIKQAKPGDIVVFHYSGHGSQVADPDKDEPDGLNSTFVPVDGTLPPAFPETGGAVKDIMGHTLYLLMSALKTENVTVVLDSCHSGGGKRGNLVVRSRGGGMQLDTPEDLNYQQQWLTRLNMTPAQFKAGRRSGIAKGAVLTGTNRNQLASDAPFDGFTAGAFTYLLTQYLWQQTGDESLSSTLANISRSTLKMTGDQEPEFEVKPGSGREKAPVYLVKPDSAPAEAVITKVDGQSVEVWLGGVDAQSLEAFAAGSTFSDSGDGKQINIQLDSRDGLIGKGRIVPGTSGKVLVGGLLQEQVRGLPTDIKLRVALDASLGKDTEQAKTMLSGVRRLEVVPLGKGPVDCILGRLDGQATATAKHSAAGVVSPTIALFTQGLTLIPDSYGAGNETIEGAVTRLQAKFKALLAARIVRMTLNTGSSKLNVAASMAPIGANSKLLAQVIPTRSAGKKSTVPGGDRRVKVGTEVRFAITNNETRDLYISVLVIDASGEIAVIFPNQWTAAADAARLAPGKTLSLPDPDKGTFNLVVQEPKGLTEVLVIASAVPIRTALKALQAVAKRGGVQNGPLAPDNPTEVIDSLLSDVTTRGGLGAKQARKVDTSQLATMSITFEVI